VVGFFFFIMGVLQWFKYRLWIYPVIGFFLCILCFQASALYPHSFSIYKVTYFITFIILVMIVIVNWSTLYGQERFELNSRRLFKLAAENIEETGDGFTQRPFSAGKIPMSKEDLKGLSRFLNGKYVVKSFHESDSIIFAFSMNKSLMKLDDPQEVSHVTIDFNGNLSVFISEADYGDFTARFTFDQLCNSMAEIFRRFMEYYQQRLESRIITELKNAR